MLKVVSTAALLALATTAALAQPAATAGGQVLRSIPAESVTVTDWYKQNVYDPADHKIGDIKDVLVDGTGKVTSLIVAVGGFLGAGEKDVAVSFDAVKTTTKGNNKRYLVMSATKDELKAAPGYKYDKTTTTWIPSSK